MKNKMTDEEVLKQIPVPPEGAVFSLRSVRSVPTGPKGDPHPYCVGPQHLSLNEGMYLNVEAVEKKGARCAMRGCGLTYAEHTSDRALFIEVPQNSDLNAVPGLHTYLLSIKEKATELGISGFAFPNKGS